MWIWMCGLALAAGPFEAPGPPVSLGLDLGMTAGEGAIGGLATLRVAVNLAPLSIELGLGEGYLAGSHREAGRISFGLRRYIWNGSYARVAFAHAHEVPWDDFVAAPFASVMGTHEEIRHRTGVEVGAGWLIGVPLRAEDGRFAVSVDVSSQIYPGQLRPMAYGSLAVGFVAHVGRPRRPRE